MFNKCFVFAGCVLGYVNAGDKLTRSGHIVDLHRTKRNSDGRSEHEAYLRTTTEHKANTDEPRRMPFVPSPSGLIWPKPSKYEALCRCCFNVRPAS